MRREEGWGAGAKTNRTGKEDEDEVEQFKKMIERRPKERLK